MRYWHFKSNKPSHEFVSYVFDHGYTQQSYTIDDVSLNWKDTEWSSATTNPPMVTETNRFNEAKKVLVVLCRFAFNKIFDLTTAEA